MFPTIPTKQYPNLHITLSLIKSVIGNVFLHKLKYKDKMVMAEMPFDSRFLLDEPWLHK